MQKVVGEAKFRLTYYFWMNFWAGEGKEMAPLKWSVHLSGWAQEWVRQAGAACVCLCAFVVLINYILL